MVKVCFVCLGNICRSPTAEGILLRQVEEAGLESQIVIDSAGTAAYHVGERADARSRATASARGVELPSRARRFGVADFRRFDYVLAMDGENHSELVALAPNPGAAGKVRYLREFESESRMKAELDVPDPYYGGDEGFARVYEICERSCRGLLEFLIDEHELQ
jgi:protein-tyrosine phosphatase